MRTRRLFASTLPLAVVAVTALGVACQKHEETPPATTPAESSTAPAPATESAAQRTLEMEQRAAEATRKLEEAQQQGLTDAQAEDAYRQFEAERQKVNQQAEGQAPPEPAPEDPPPPPQ